MRMRQDIMVSLTHFQTVGDNGNELQFESYVRLPNETEVKKFLLNKRLSCRAQGSIKLSNGETKQTRTGWKIPGADRYHQRYTQK